MAKKTKRKLSEATWAIRITPKHGEPFLKPLYGNIELFDTRDEASSYKNKQSFPTKHWKVVRVDVTERG